MQVFEHEFLGFRDGFEQRHWKAMSRLNELHGGRYFDIRHNGIKFKNYVGVLRVDGLTIEILPKIRGTQEDKETWQKVLIEMLKVTRNLKVRNVDEADVKRQNVHLLDLYFEWFLEEVQKLIRQGMVKKYYQETSNVKALKGKIEFAGNIRHNLVHRERFYTTHQVYGTDHLLHQALGKALQIVARMSKGTPLYAKCKRIELDFPEFTETPITAAMLDNIVLSRKTAPYETALKIAKPIILQYAPDAKGGREEMLALLFDMNALWEQYILAKLRSVKRNDLQTVLGQRQKPFWGSISVRPDIVLQTTKGTFIIDTKWKNIDDDKPSVDDLRQIFVYNEYWESTHAVLLYPSTTTDFQPGIAFEPRPRMRPCQAHGCSIAKVSVLDGKMLDAGIGEKIIRELLRVGAPAF